MEQTFDDIGKNSRSKRIKATLFFLHNLKELFYSQNVYLLVQDSIGTVLVMVHRPALAEHWWYNRIYVCYLVFL